MLRIIALSVVLCAASLGSAAAQQTERETQVAIDPTLGIVEIDARLRAELGLFQEIQGFETARLFRTSAGTYVLEISSGQQGSITRERRVLTEAALTTLRADIGSRLSASGRTRVFEREGRPGFIVGQTVIGLGYHGWAIPEALDIDSDRGRVATYLLTSGASFLVPWLITNDRAVTIAQRDLSFWGGTRGILAGLTLGELVRPEKSPTPPNYFSDDTADRVRLGLGSLASVVGSVVGYNSARLANHDRGTVALWGTVGDFGIAGAYATSYALGLYPDRQECRILETFPPQTICEDRSQRAGNATTLALGLASLYGAKKWGEAESYTVGDARALRSFGALGAQVALPGAFKAFDDPAAGNDNGSRAITASAVGGAAVGLYFGNKALRSTSLSGGDGLLVEAGHIAGGLAALGITYLVDSGSRAGATTYLTTSAIGSVAGSLLTFNAVKGNRPDGIGALPGDRSPTIELDASGLIAPLVALRNPPSASSRPSSHSLLRIRF